MIAPRPYALLAEITYRCPLHCPYCSNPTQTRNDQELTTSEWTRVIREAAALGVLQIGFSGGEPLARRDLPEMVRAARAANLYTNLITSGIGLDDDRVRALRDAGLDSVQLSFQSDNSDLADEIAGARAHQRKLDAAAKIRAVGIPLSLNFVIHRRNIDRLPQMIELAESLQAERVELANVQFYGWALLNRAALLPTREQVVRAREIATASKARLAGKIDIFYVLPDYYETRPKPCLNGWGQRYLTVNPTGDVLPCSRDANRRRHAARSRIDAEHAVVGAARDPQRALAERHPVGRVVPPEEDGLMLRSGGGGEARQHRARIAVRPDGLPADGDRAGRRCRERVAEPVARHRRRDDLVRLRLDAGHGAAVADCVGHPDGVVADRDRARRAPGADGRDNPLRLGIDP